MERLNTEYMRTQIQFGTNCYNGPEWAKKVLSWPDQKVKAVYLSFFRRGLFEPIRRRPVNNKKGCSDGVQISMFQLYGKDLKNIK